MNNALEIQNVHYSYSDKKNILTGVYWSIPPGQSVGLIGSNGAGKTTLFLLSAGVYKPDRGSIQVFGAPVKYSGYNENIGYVFQNPDDMLFSPTVWDDIAFGPLNQGLSKSEIHELVHRTLSDFGIDELEARAPQHLSGGEKRLVSIAAAVVLKPKILLLDEPNSDLDNRARRKLINALTGLNITKVISSHDLEFVLETCTHAALLSQGKIIAYGESSVLLADKELMEQCGQEIPHSLR